MLLTLAVITLVQLVGVEGPNNLAVVLGSSIAFVLVCEHLIPLLIVRRNPERVLSLLLPSFDPIVARALAGAEPADRRAAGIATRPPSAEVAGDEQGQATDAYLDAGEQEGLIERDERRLLQSIVDFGDTLVREVMTPRPDIVRDPRRRHAWTTCAPASASRGTRACRSTPSRSTTSSDSCSSRT